MLVDRNQPLAGAINHQDLYGSRARGSGTTQANTLPRAYASTTEVTDLATQDNRTIPTREHGEAALRRLGFESGAELRAAGLQQQVSEASGPAEAGGVRRASTEAEAAEIARLEHKYGVEITRLDDGRYMIRAEPVGTDASDSGYAIRVRPLGLDPGTVPINPIGVHVGHLISDQEMLVAEGRAVVDRYNSGFLPDWVPGWAPGTPPEDSIPTEDLIDPDAQRDADVAAVRELAQRTGFAGSPLNRAAVVAASARTGFAVPAEVFDADPFFGGAGAGANIVAGGGPGGLLSKIGIAHDTDWFLGWAMAAGPMAGLHEFRRRPHPEIPSGLHGLAGSQDLAPFVALESLQRLELDVSQYPSLRDVPIYDSVSDTEGWNITILSL